LYLDFADTNSQTRFSLIPLAETVVHAGQKIFGTINRMELNSAQNRVIRDFGRLWCKTGVVQT
jgi:hypothetical protein